MSKLESNAGAGHEDRAYWLKQLEAVAKPVLTAP